MLPDPSLPPIARLRKIIARLRAPGGCPWDREQTHASLRAGLIEETYEVLAAIDAGDDANLQEELGDLLLQVVMHAQMASERGAFDFDAVAATVADKMVRRHPHVFGEDAAAMAATVSDSDAVLSRWEQIKRREKGASAAGQGILHGLLSALPALLRAQKVQAKAARVGFDWQEAPPVLDKVREEVAEVAALLDNPSPGAGPDRDHLAEEIGDLFFAVVNLARWHRLESELLLHRATDKFARRFQGVEARLAAGGKRWEESSPAELDALWEEVKKSERAGAPG